MKFNELGRSMVEMLGVLAIIGVLSVGAISGYAKAMMKYRLNKHIESVNYLINFALQNVSTFSKTQGQGQTQYAAIMNKLGLIPDGIIYDEINSAYNMYDIFGNKINIYSNVFESGKYEYVFRIAIDKSDVGVQVCQNIVSVAKANRDFIYFIQSLAADEEGVDSKKNIYGSSYCNKNVKCLANITVKDSFDMCNFCFQNSQNCRVAMVWY